MKIKHIVFDHDGTLADTTERPFNLYPGLAELMTDLHSKGIKFYVWTARDRKSTLESLKSMDILRYVEDLRTSSDSPPKPATYALEDMLEGVNPQEVVMIGDSTRDITGGKEFGAMTIAALWAHVDEDYQQYVKNIGPDHFYTSVKECHQFLLRKI